ncbi:HesA/MoeB/ThiF family protein [Myxococcota bacterium]|nr:HesA/MoeB/ThiF family protein [Myxococcota bacterium]MBU1430243.1 HesA/MoeB/ThiF family protein [Myxococcota bacterium]MBU1898353.1 HesA/MoeB/ThiF family protein [Myxococcota bacterium]
MEDRFARHEALLGAASAGLAHKRALIVGVGALGSASAERLTRAGVRRLRIIDPDRLSPSNLPRQTALHEGDLGALKVEALARRLKEIDARVIVEARAARATPEGLPALLEGVDVVLDGLDNFEARLWLNDACAAAKIPWIYGGVLATQGMSLTITGRPCLRCLMPEAPPPGLLPENAEIGVLNTLPWLIAGVQVTEAIKLLAGIAPRAGLLVMDPWRGEFEVRSIEARAGCACVAQ